MVKRAAPQNPKRFLARHKYFKRALIVFLVTVALMVGGTIYSKTQNAARQARLQPFYNTQNLARAGQLGEVVRQEPLSVSVPGGSGVRVLYRTQRADGSYTFSSGMVFIPNQVSSKPRPVVAWAHGTLGLGDSCVPSRIKNPVKGLAGVSDMLNKGWVVTATDYAGFGTPGTQGYLIGSDEARDVLNSVRAARNLRQAQAGSDFVVWGHSQGGSSALFTTSQAAAYAPELRLVATAASAPAAELVPLLNEQYNTVADWVIGPIIATAWPAANHDLSLAGVLTASGRDNYQRIANQCIVQSTLAGLVRNALGQKFFSTNLINVPSWRAMAEQQSAPLLKPDQPLLVVESKTDKVVLPDTTALYIQRSCQAGSNLATLWLDKVPHQSIPAKSADQVIAWIGDRFAGQPNSSSCSQPLPFTPAVIPPSKP